MDFQGYLLIGAIAVLSFMLLTEWVQFKEQSVEISDNSIEQYTNKTEAITPAATDFTIPSEHINNSDVPNAEVPEAKTPSAAEQQHSNIRVQTDTLDVVISTEGGDVLFAALPQFYAKIDTPESAFAVLEDNQQRTYIAQSGLIGKDGTDTSDGRPVFSSANSNYKMSAGQDTLNVDLIYQADNQVTITKRFIFQRASYVINIEYLINNKGSSEWSAGIFGQLKRDNTEAESSAGMGMQPYLGAAATLQDEPFKKISFSDMAEKNHKWSLQGGWVAILQHYFLSAWIPNPEITHSYSTIVTKTSLNIIRFTSPAISVAPGEQGVIKSELYVGPKDQYSLEEISPGLELSVDYGILWWIAQPLFWLLVKINSVLGNWGFSIIAVTILVKLLFFQLNAKAYTSMANMRKVQPKLLALRERYADDKQKQSQEMMALYKKEKINPLGGCLPILVQMPVFISLYWVLMESVELRHAPFIGWIQDLSVMDPYFVLPLIMGVSMFIQQKLNPPPPDPMQAKVMQWMPVMFTFFFLFFPSGLVLYWVVNNILSIAQQYIITKRIENS